MTTITATPTLAVMASADPELVRAARLKEPHAYAELFRRWYDRSYDVALTIVRDRETAASVAQDALLAGRETLARLRDPGAFGAWILRATRNRALERVPRDRFRAMEPIKAHQEAEAMRGPQADSRLHDEHSERHRLIWTTAAALGEHDTSLLDLHLRHGLTLAELADELRTTQDEASQLLFQLRRRLREVVAAVMLWHDGNPTCTDLARLLPAATPFDSATASTIRSHQRTCEDCQREITRQGNAERLFATVPFAVAAPVFKERAAEALARTGAPMAPARPLVFSATAPSFPPTGPTILPKEPAVIPTEPEALPATPPTPSAEPEAPPATPPIPSAEPEAPPATPPIPSAAPAFALGRRAGVSRPRQGGKIVGVTAALVGLALVMAGVAVLGPKGRTWYLASTGQLPIASEEMTARQRGMVDRQPPESGVAPVTRPTTAADGGPIARTATSPAPGHPPTTGPAVGATSGGISGKVPPPAPTPSRSSTPVSTPTPTGNQPTSPSAFCTYAYQVGADSSGARTADLTITNVSGKTWNGWTAVFSLSPTARAVSGWGGTFAVSGSSVTFTPNAALAKIPTNSWVMLAFQAPSSATPTVSSLSVQGHACRRA